MKFFETYFYGQTDGKKIYLNFLHKSNRKWSKMELFDGIH